jgi:hypothetical protein
VVWESQANIPVGELINDLSQAYIFDTVADMQASTIVFPVGKRIEWSGYYIKSDGGGNWGTVKTGAHTDDGGSIISINANTYVEANFNTQATSSQFGCTNLGPSDSNKLLNLKEYCYANNKEFIFSALHNIDEPLVFDKDNITIKGLNRSTCGVQNTAPTPAIVQSPSGTDHLQNIVMDNFAIFGDSDPAAHTGTTGNGLEFRKVGNACTYKDLNILRNARGVYSEDSFTPKLDNLIVQHNRDEGVWTQSGSNNFLFSNSEINFNGKTGVRLGGLANGLDTCNVEGNEEDQVILTGRSQNLHNCYIERPARAPFAMLRVDGCVGWSVTGSTYFNDEGPQAGPGAINHILVTGNSSIGLAQFSVVYRNTTGDAIDFQVDSGSDNVFEAIATSTFINNSGITNVKNLPSRPKSISGTSSATNGQVISHNIGLIPADINITALSPNGRFTGYTNKTATTFTLKLLNSDSNSINIAETVTWTAYV